ncbi:MAG: nucleotidyltransferase domain-containing protein [Planctomycetaceae bacterium]|nr:nucleotidyltransferase domain-containing protein [Planctomycetaceae bacterium]
MLEFVKEELTLIKDVIVSMVPTEAIYLFGSYAYGEPHQDSDLDIYVVVADGEFDTIDICTKIRSALYKKKTIPMDLLINPKSVFDNQKEKVSLENVIIKKGIKIYGD